MKKLSFVLIVSIPLLAALISLAGCSEQNALGAKKSKLLADENHRLRYQIKACNKKLSKQTKLLAECKQQKTESTTFLMETAVRDLAEKNKQLEDENKLLKAQIEQSAPK